MKAADEAELQSVYLNQCALPLKADKFTFGNFKDYRADLKRAREAAEVVAESSGDKSPWLALIGDNGCGKTHLAVAIVNRWLERGRPARYAKASTLLKDLSSGFGKDGDDSYEAMFNFYCRIGLLLIDDLGIESSSYGDRQTWAKSQLETIVDERDMNCLPLLITSNHGLELWPRRIAKRMEREQGRTVVYLTAPDYQTNGGTK